MKITKSERETLFKKFNGKCAYCGFNLVKGWHADHIEPIGRTRKWDKDRTKLISVIDKPDRHNIENMNPACASCNINKRERSLEGFREFIAGFIVSLNRDSVQYQVAKRFDLIIENSIEVQFYFETV